MIARDGFALLGHDPAVARWAENAADVMRDIVRQPDVRATNLRHGGTWFVGVDVLPNDATGGLNDVPLRAPWRADLPDLPLHRAQVSIIYAGYPRQDAEESDANHRFRIKRCAAHVDGLLPVGPDKRRYPQEFHAYILGLPLNAVAAAPTVVWRGSHKIMQPALAEVIGDAPPDQMDVTEAYQAARREVFARCEMVKLHPKVGEAMLIHRFALHGTHPWDDTSSIDAPDGRMIAFFRPETTASDWLAP